MMTADDGHVIVDVRRQDEYEAGHIPGAILIPNENIGATQPEELPDPDRIVLVYCRSGNRSKQAAQKLAAKRYEQNDDFFVRMFSDLDMMQQVMDTVGSVLYQRLKKKKGPVRYEIQASSYRSYSGISRKLLA